jgi:membrane-bound metal-dependent hydrolase YbcI (DUF457 family)
VCSWLLVQAIADKQLRNVAFAGVIGGGALHVALDALQAHVAFGYRWLFPFSWARSDWGLFSPEDTLPLVPLATLLVVVIEVVMQRKQHRRRNDASSLADRRTAEVPANNP